MTVVMFHYHKSTLELHVYQRLTKRPLSSHRCGVYVAGWQNEEDYCKRMMKKKMMKKKRGRLMIMFENRNCLQELILLIFFLSKNTKAKFRKMRLNWKKCIPNSIKSTNIREVD